MRLATFQLQGGAPRAGVFRADGALVDLRASDSSLPGGVRALLEAGDPALQSAAWIASQPSAVVVRDYQLLAPIPDPRKVVCVGLNYRDHALETKAAIPREPVIFNKFPTAVIGPEAPIELPSVSDQVDYEAELVIVVGKRAKRLSRENAMAAVAGYTIGHDVSARDWQKNKDGKQWLLGKTFDTFAPLGPVLVTADEVADPHDLRVQFRLNGRTMQDSNTSQLIFRIPELLAYASQVFTLEPGDLLFTGTPAGVGMARTPPVFLKPGDVCEVEISGLGVLRNPCVQG